MQSDYFILVVLPCFMDVTIFLLFSLGDTIKWSQRMSLIITFNGPQYVRTPLKKPETLTNTALSLYCQGTVY